MDRRGLEMENKYNPNAWNKWPDVTPPEGVWMRIDCKNGDKLVAYYRVFDRGNGEWISPRGNYYSKFYTVPKFVRFRPWDE